MNLKKFLAGVLACCIVGGLLPSVGRTADNAAITASAVDYTEGTYEQLSYKNYGDYIEITGCDSSATSVVIPEKINGVPVTSIGNSAFYECKNLKKINFPDSITSIGSNAFYGTPWLESKKEENPLVIVNKILIDGETCLGDVVIPDNITHICGYAFAGCKKLTKITIPDSVTSIGEGAFNYCTELTEIAIPDSVTSIGAWAFNKCTGLTEINIPDKVTNIGGHI